MLLYYITDRKGFSGSEAERRTRLLKKIGEAGRAAIDYIQLREKDLSVRELQALAREALRELQDSSPTALLINSRVDVAIAVGAQGAHLPAGDLSASEARVIFAKAGCERPVIAASCHSAQEIALAESQGADLAVLGPIFGKTGAAPSSGIGLEKLRAACRREAAAASLMPVLALGGVTMENAAGCIHAGAAGIAAIRLFQENDIADVVRRLRKLETCAPRSSARAGGVRHAYWKT